jgi:hypothetical protein
MKRTKLSALAVVAALGLGATGAAVHFASAADSPPSTLIAITPCRLFDTRNVTGLHVGPFVAGETATIPVVGTHGDCTIPAGATVVNFNLTAIAPTAAGFVTVFPADVTKPIAANLNWIAGQAPTTNAVTVGLSAPDGAIKIFNNSGNVDIGVDIVGYYVPGGSGGALPTADKWGPMDRNTIGSPVAALRSGPIQPIQTPRFHPPFGTGSLGLGAATGEKATFGNEYDFVGGDFSALTEVGFHVYNVSENINQGLGNMPSIAFEVDPNLTAAPGDNFSTVSFVPNVTLPGWSNFIDATTTGSWIGTGLGGACDVTSTGCTWDQLQAFFDDGDGVPPTILTVSIVTRGDLAWHGAVDGLRINNTVYNFEEHGVVATTTP